MENCVVKPKLWTKNLCFISIAVFFMFNAFYMLMPIIAMYVVDRFGADVSVAGVVVSVYVITALFLRPFSGYFVDKYDRKKLYCLAYVVFGLLCLGYIFAASVALLIVLRMCLGATFSMVTTAGSTLAIDLMPSERRGEGIGYMGALTVLSMAAGPMIGLYFKSLFSYEGLFVSAFVSCLIGCFFAFSIKTKPRPHVVHAPMSLDRFYLKSATSLAIVIAIANFPYGTLMAYIPLYLQESGVNAEAGNFFFYLSIGVVASRLLTGKLLNKGLQNMLLTIGLFGLIIAFSIFSFFMNEQMFIVSSLLVGISYGLTSPSIQSMVIDLVPHSKRGTANSTYFVALDLGAGLGMLLGGFVASMTSYNTLMIISLGLIVVALIVYKLYSYNNYMKHLAESKNV
ncbi:MAG: MFS transporter [Rikenellaceae bacterium]